MSNYFIQLIPEKLLPGYDIHVRRYSLLGKLIRSALSIRGWKCWGSHDAMVCSICDKVMVGDAVFPKCKLNTLEKVNEDLKSGKVEVRVYRPIKYTIEKGKLAAEYWVVNIHGTFYDIFAIPRLLLRSIFGEWFEWAAGITWANWCTEGWMKGWRDGAKYDPILNNNPTPLTMEKRLQDQYGGTMEDVTKDSTKIVYVD